MKKILLFGASGSIGKSTLEVIRKHPDKFLLCGAHCHSDKDFLDKIKNEFNITTTALSYCEDNSIYQKLIDNAKPDIVVNGIATSAGLFASYTTLKNGIDLALANKESLVMAGSLLKKEAKKSGAHILPVDSEHWGLFSLLQDKKIETIKSLWLTASGGPFLNRPLHEFKSITPIEATNHPTWKMGKKISIDSATMANKGLELIEAVELFNMDESKIKVTIQPTSHVHALMQTIDGSFYAQISNPTMQLPILNALSYPDIINSDIGGLDLSELTLVFKQPEPQRYPLLALAREAVKIGAWGKVAYNAANEAAVDFFIQNKIKFTQIANVVENVLSKQGEVDAEIDGIISTHKEIYNQACNYCKGLS